MQYAKKQKLDLTLMVVDAEKAFDQLEWAYLFELFLNFLRK